MDNTHGQVGRTSAGAGWVSRAERWSRCGSFVNARFSTHAKVVNTFHAVGSSHDNNTSVRFVLTAHIAPKDILVLLGDR